MVRECAPDSRISPRCRGKRPVRRLGGKECGVPPNRVSAKGRDQLFATWAFAGCGRWNCVLWHCCEEARTKFQGFRRGLDKSPVRRNAKRESGVELEGVRTRFQDFGRAPGQKTRSQVGREGMWCPPNRVSAKGRNPFFATWAFAGSGRWNCVLWHCCEEARTRFRDFGKAPGQKPRSPQRPKGMWCTGNAQATHRRAKSKEKGPHARSEGAQTSQQATQN